MTMEFQYEYKLTDLHLNINGISIVVTREVNSKADVILLSRPHFRNTELNHKTIISSAQISQIVGFDGLVYNQAYKYQDLIFKVEASSVYWCNFIINLPNGQEILIINSLLQDDYIRLYPQREADFVFDNVDEQQRLQLSQLAFAVGELRSIGGSKPTSFQNIAMQMVATLKKPEGVYFKCTLDDLIATVEYIIGVMESTNMKAPIFMVGLDLLDLLMRPIRPDILLQQLQDKMWNGKFPFQYMEYIEEKKMHFISPKDLVKVSGAAVIISMLDFEQNGLNVAIGDKKTSILARESVPRLNFEHKFHSLKRFGNNILERKPGMMQLVLQNTEYYYVDHSVLDCTVEKGYVNYTLQQNQEPINRQDKKLKLMETSSISLDALI